MTAQIENMAIFKNETYYIVAQECPLKFDPSDYGINPIPISSACSKGYFYELALNTQLRLRNLYVMAESYPKINDVEAVMNRHDFFLGNFHVYKDIGISFEYTGGMIIGKDLLPSYCSHMAIQKPYVYKKVYEIVFEKGILKMAYDCSEKMKEVRADLDLQQNIDMERAKIFLKEDIFIRNYEINKIYY